MRSKYVAQAYLYGDSLKSCCVGIICPDEEETMKWAKENSVSGTFEDVCLGDVRLVNQNLNSCLLG